MRVNAPLSAQLRAALGLVGSEWNPELIEAVQPVVILAGAEASSSGASTVDAPAFMRSYNYAGAAGVVPTHQVANPAGSNVDLLVDAFNLTVSVAGSILLVRDGAVPALVGPGFNKDFDGVGSVAEYRAGGLAAVGGDLLMHLESAGAGDRQYAFVGAPILLPPGHNLTVWLNVVAASMRGGFEWRERQR